MLRQVSSRNQRAKGFRLQHALQIGILVAICIWLLYQVKHSHEKKIAYDAQHSKLIKKPIDTQQDFFNFGRKDIHSEEKSEEAQEEEEEEEEFRQEESKDEEVDEAGGDGIDEQDQYADEETEEEVKEMEERQVNEVKETRAREENYKRDDASSAVVHVTHATESETVMGNATSVQEMETKEVVNATFAGSNGENSTMNNGTIPLNITSAEIQSDLQVNATVAVELSANSTTLSESQSEAKNNSTVELLPSEVKMSNVTVFLDPVRDQNATVNNVALVGRDEKTNSTTAQNSTTNEKESVGLKDTDSRIENEAKAMDEEATA